MDHVVCDLGQGLALQQAGVRWVPTDGDHFALPGRDLDDRVFVLSHMVVEVVQTPTGPLLAFNGTTEWALDSVSVDEAVWLPLEHQLRDLLGGAFAALEALPGPEPGTGGWAVRLAEDVAERRGVPARHVDTSPVSAYCRAVLALSRR